MSTTFEIFLFGLISFVSQDDAYIDVEVLDDAEHYPFVYLGAPTSDWFPLTADFKIKLPPGEVKTAVNHIGNIPHLSEVAYRFDGQPVKLKRTPPLVVRIPLPKGKLTVADYYPNLGQRTRPGAQPAPIPRISVLKTLVDDDVEIVVDSATTKKVQQYAFVLIGNFGVEHHHSHFPKHRLLTNGDAIDDLIQTTSTTSPNGEPTDNIDDVRRLLEATASGSGAQRSAAQIDRQDAAKLIPFIYTQVDCSSSQYP